MEPFGIHGRREIDFHARYGRNWMLIAVAFPGTALDHWEWELAARKEPCRAGPLRVVNVGSASTWRICLCSRSCTVSPTSSLVLYRKILSGLLTCKRRTAARGTCGELPGGSSNGGTSAGKKC